MFLYLIFGAARFYNEGVVVFFSIRILRARLDKPSIFARLLMAATNFLDLVLSPFSVV